MKVTYLTMGQAARIIPSRPNSSTVWRWAKRGVRGIQLRHIRVGTKVLTTEAWVAEFLAACNQSDAERAEAELTFRQGILDGTATTTIPDADD